MELLLKINDLSSNEIIRGFVIGSDEWGKGRERMMI